MVTADNLNLDVLEQIFNFLSEDDLPSSALVNQSFFAAATPRLYNAISYGLRHSIGYDNVHQSLTSYSNLTNLLSRQTGILRIISPFATLIARPHLAVHVRHIGAPKLFEHDFEKDLTLFSEIRVVPRIKSSPHPVFMRECREALVLCHNLRMFNCAACNVLPILLPSLQETTRLRDLRVYSNLTTLQAKMLTSIKNLTNVSIEFASSNVVVNLPSWMQILSNTLHSLTLFVSAHPSHKDIILIRVFYLR